MVLTTLEHNNKILIGINNRYIQLPFVHPWLTFFPIYLFIIFISSINYNFDRMILTIFISLPVCILIILFVVIYHRRTCYKLVINRATKKVTFHLMFSKTAIVTSLDNISIQIGREIKIHINNESYRIFTETLHDVVSYLPINTEIVFLGFFGKQFQKELERKNKPLTPGRQL